MTNVCPTCGESFAVNPRVGKRHKFCSTKCQRKGVPSYNRGRMNPWVSRPCLQCGQEFDRSSKNGGARRYCSTACKLAAASERFYDQRWRHLARRYGVSRDHFEQMFADQGGACAICSIALNGRGLERDSPQVDHDHATGKPRAILCRPCNTALGMFRDDPVLVESAAKYLRGWGATGVEQAG